MATSVIDYIFRDLAISYLNRNDLGQIKPEDLLSTGTGDEPAHTSTGTGKSHTKTTSKAAAVEHAAPAVKDPEAQRIAQARIKGYEGDPCPSCGSLTLVRNGTCMKCDTCGGTTGCS
jgi:ribonucleoside-diphosphate reductase alpha chain